MKSVVVIGGGTGVFTVLSGLRQYPLNLTAIVSMSDDGGSTGVLREEFGVLPPGDIRRALIALSDADKTLADLFNYRFKEGSSLKGHSLGNLLLTALERITGSFNDGIKEAVRILNVKGQVIPVTLTPSRLCAILEDGTKIEGETNIDIPKHNPNLKITKVFLDPEVDANPEALQAIKNADVVILGPGDVYTSILPNLAVKGIINSIKKSKGKVFYIANIMTKYGETNNFKASDFLNKIEDQVGEARINKCFVNTRKPKNTKIIDRYKKEHVEFVENDFLNSDKKIVAGDFLRHGMFLRHDPEKLAKKIYSEIS